MSQKKILSINSISKTFGSIFANEKIDLELFEGEILALLGENGAGKTTLMNMLFGHYLPDSGNVEIMSSNSDLVPLELGNPSAALAVGIGMVHQHFMLVENFSVLENIILGFEGELVFGKNLDKAKKDLKNLCDTYKLNIDLESTISDLSVGFRQRVEILKSLYRGAEILILDEPTGVLTPQEVDELFKILRSLSLFFFIFP